MIIQTLKMKNYRRYKDEFIEFPDGLFGIVGNNGAGKTTIIEAVAWAIYGVKGAKTGKEFIKREDSEPNSDCSVELEFSLGGDTYRVIRELRGKRSNPYAALYTNSGSRPEIVGINPVTEYLTKKLGMDHNSFFTSVFTKQKELDALSDLTPATRKKRILQLLQIDKIDVAIKTLRKDKKESEIRIDAISKTLHDIDKLNSQFEDLKKEKLTNTNTLKELRQELKKANESKSKAKKVWDRFEKSTNIFSLLIKILEFNKPRKNLTKII